MERRPEAGAASRPRRAGGTRGAAHVRASAGLAALRAGIGATAARPGRPRLPWVREGEWPAAGGPWPARAGRRLAQLRLEEAESTLAWAQVDLTEHKFKGRREHGLPIRDGGGALSDSQTLGAGRELEHLCKLFP